MRNMSRQMAAAALSVSLIMSGSNGMERVLAAGPPAKLDKLSKIGITTDSQISSDVEFKDSAKETSVVTTNGVCSSLNELLGDSGNWPGEDGCVKTDFNGKKIYIRRIDDLLGGNRYTATDSDGVEIFSADSDGAITYSSSLWADYDSSTGMVYAEPEGDLVYSGLSGLITAALSQEGYWYTREDDSEASSISPVFNTDNMVRDNLGRTFELPGAGNVHIEYTDNTDANAPDEAQYVCLNDSGQVIFYADKDENIIYNLSDIVDFDNGRFLTESADNTADSGVYKILTGSSDLNLGGTKEDASLVSSYEQLGMRHYPLAGEEIQFALGDQVFSVTRADQEANEGYICRSDDGGVVFTADTSGTLDYDSPSEDADYILLAGRKSLDEKESIPYVASHIMDSISSLTPIDEEQPGEEEADVMDALQDEEDVSGLTAIDAQERPSSMSELLGEDALPEGDEYVNLKVSLHGAARDVLVRRQTDRDLANLDEYGVWRDENGDIAEGNFRQYIGVTTDGQLLFTADKKGNISYRDDMSLYYDATEKRFYSDEDKSICLTGLQGLLDSSGLAMDGDTVMALLEHASGTSATIELPVDHISGSAAGTSKVISSSDGRYASEASSDEASKQFMIWNVTDSDREYAPSFARYVCANTEGQVLFYADDEGRIYYDASDSVIYGKHYFFAFLGDGESEDTREKNKEGKVVVRYTDLGFAHYPGPGEVNYFTADGKAFAVSLYDTSEGAKGRYICRNVTDIYYLEDGTPAAGTDLPDQDTSKITVNGIEYDDLSSDESIIMLMDLNGNICYAADDFEWQFVDYDLDYALLRRLVEEGRSTDEAIEDAMVEAVDEDIDTLAEENAEVDLEVTEEAPEEEEEPEIPDDDVEVNGLTRDDFDSDEEWMDYINGDNEDEDLVYLKDDEEDEDEDSNEDEDEDIDDEKAIIMEQQAARAAAEESMQMEQTDY